jgi:dihydrofolate reductase
MTAVEANISMSLDGYVTGPGVEQTPGLGDGGEALHAWLDDEDGRLVNDEFAAAGAVVTSRRVFEDTGGWGDDGHLLPPGVRRDAGPHRMPVFVVTHRPHDPVVKDRSTFTFVTDGITAAVARAAEAAGDKHVEIMGGASIIRQAIDAGVVDRLRLHLAPVLLGSGTRLFRNGVPARLRLLAHEDTRHAVHLTYEIQRDNAAG